MTGETSAERPLSESCRYECADKCVRIVYVYVTCSNKAEVTHWNNGRIKNGERKTERSLIFSYIVDGNQKILFKADKPRGQKA